MNPTNALEETPVAPGHLAKMRPDRNAALRLAAHEDHKIGILAGFDARAFIEMISEEPGKTAFDM